MNAAIATPASELSALFSAVRPGAPVIAGELTLVPLFRPFDDAWGPDADLLEEGLARGRTTVTEVNESGVVARVRVHHTGERPLLLVDGEQILGAKQNRVVNASFLVAAGVTVDVPVSCVERGRWHATTGSSFIASETTLSGSARFEKLKRVTTSVSSGRGYDADQSEVWRDVDSYLSRSQVASATSSYADGYARRRSEIDGRLAALAPQHGQIGVAAFRGEQLLGCDLFGSPALYARGHGKVLRGLLADVADVATGPTSRPLERLAEALGALAGADVARATGPGGGETLHGVAGGLSVGAVVLRGRVYHAAIAG